MMMIAYSWQGAPKTHQQTWSETTVSCIQGAIPSCRVRSLIPWITSELLVPWFCFPSHAHCYCPSLTWYPVLVGELVACLVDPTGSYEYSCWPYKSCLQCPLCWDCGESSHSLWSVVGISLTLLFCQAMYPSLILIIVNEKSSIIDSFASNTVLGSDLSTKHHSAIIVFANPPTSTKGTVVDNEQSLWSRHSMVPGSPESSDSCLELGSPE